MRTDLVFINKKKRTCLIDFAMQVDDRVKVKEDEKLNLTREQKKMPQHDGDSDTNHRSLEIVSKNLEKRD